MDIAKGRYGVQRRFFFKLYNIVLVLLYINIFLRNLYLDGKGLIKK